MSNAPPRETDASRSVTVYMADKFGMDPRAFESTVRAICLPQKAGDPPATREEFAAFLLVAKEYDLNPLLKEIYGFRGKGGIQPVVSIDGWSSLINRRPELDGIEFVDHPTPNNKDLAAITAKIWRKDRSKPVVVTEYMEECKRGTDPWRQWPRRMLRHKALIQAARYAFGFTGIVDPDEAERLRVDDAPMTARQAAVASAPPPPEEPPPAVAALTTVIGAEADNRIAEPKADMGNPISEPAPTDAEFIDDAPPEDAPPEEPPAPAKPKVEIDDVTFIRNIEGELKKLAIGDPGLFAKFEAINTACESRMEGGMFPPDAGALADLIERYRKELDL